MDLGQRRGLAPGRKSPDDPLGDGTLSPLVLGEDDRRRRLNVHDLDPGLVVGEEVDPALPGEPEQVRGVEGERTTRPEELPATFPPDLDHLALGMPAIIVTVQR